MKRIIFVLPIAIFLVGCATTSLSTMQRRSIEAKELEGNFDDAFKATITVLQDKGFIIDHTDFNAGVIKAKTGKKQGWWSEYNYNVSATIEQFGDNRVKERVVFLQESKVDYGQYGSTESSKIIEDPKFLQEVYDAIQKEMFVRKNLSK